MNIVVQQDSVSFASWYPQYVRKTLHSALADFAESIGRVSVYLLEQTGGTGTLYKSCRLVIHTVLGEQIVVKSSQKDASLAIQSAVGRAVRSLSSEK